MGTVPMILAYLLHRRNEPALYNGSMTTRWFRLSFLVSLVAAEATATVRMMSEFAA